MFKVSFKSSKDSSFRRVEKFNDKVTIVTLKGELKLPGWWHGLPLNLKNSFSKNNVDIKTSLPLGSIIYITAKGKAKRCDEDTDNPKLAEKIAEVRALIKIYELLEKATSKIVTHYFKRLYGDTTIRKIGYKNNSDSVYEVHQKYKALLIKESHYLGNLLKEA